MHRIFFYAVCCSPFSSLLLQEGFFFLSVSTFSLASDFLFGFPFVVAVLRLGCMLLVRNFYNFYPHGTRSFVWDRFFAYFVLCLGLLAVLPFHCVYLIYLFLYFVRKASD